MDIPVESGGVLIAIGVVVLSLLFYLGFARGTKVGAVPTLTDSQFDPEEYAARNHFYLNELHELYGRTFFARPTPGDSVPVLFTCEPRLVAKVLKGGNKSNFEPARCPATVFNESTAHGFATRSSFDLVQPMSRGTVFDLTGESWKTQRKCLAGIFAVTDAGTKQFTTAAGDILDKWFTQASWETVDTQVLSYVLCVQGTMISLFGPELRLSDQQCTQVKSALAVFGRRFTEAGACESIGAADHDSYAETINNVCTEAVDWGMANLQDCDPKGGFRKLLVAGVEKAGLVATVANFVVAAAESPASALSHTLGRLAALPESERADVVGKVRSELQGALAGVGDGGEELDKSAAAKLVLADALVNEGMRHRAPATLVCREAVEDTMALAGSDDKQQNQLSIKQGTSVRVCLHSLHSDTTTWERPNDFDPARFQDGGSGVQAKDKSFMPFSRGSRGCPGGPLSMMWMKISLALIIERLELRPSANSATQGIRVKKFVSWIGVGGIPVDFRVRTT